MEQHYPDIVAWFRGAAPYIKSQRGCVFVIYCSGEVIADAGRLPGLIADFALLHSLGVKLVLVHGARPQIEQKLKSGGISARYANGLCITEEETLTLIKETIATIRFDIEARLSMEPVNIPAGNAAGGHHNRIRVASGNFVTGRPVGVRGGVDFGYTGEVRGIDTHAIRALLDTDHIVLISSLGLSPTGEIFNLNAPDLAVAVAASLPAEKLVLLDGARISSAPPWGRRPGQIALSEAQSLLPGGKDARGMPGEDREGEETRGFYRHLGRAVRACRAGVRRTHLIDHRVDGALLLEVYTRDGVGVMVCADAYDTLRRALIGDIAGVIRLITPLEEQGILVRRSREKLEAEIDRFLVMERDGAIIACAAAYPCIDTSDSGPAVKMAELACLAVHQDYRNAECGNALLMAIEKETRARGMTHLFVLTTHTEHWFREHGFSRAGLGELPRTRQRMYNENRNAKVLIKPL
uniref:Amino-acid acetyltransferase n=1 Tax=Candidatus Kentrum sp. DK TaxID=2126562 RepID=A0A450SX88_9GAMM|nr:MAG: N-acetylglutamate synthase [Candidatus Kentron sp. DK]